MRLAPPAIAPLVALRRCRRDLCARVAALRAQPDDAFVHDFPAVVTAVEAGFRHEETLLELLGDAGLHPRRADRAVILCALHRTLPQVEGGDIALGRQVADALDAVLTLPWDTAAAHVARAHVAHAHVADAHVADAHVADAHVTGHVLTAVPRRRVRSRQRPAARAD
jgi:hypothetical protein